MATISAQMRIEAMSNQHHCTTGSSFAPDHDASFASSPYHLYVGPQSPPTTAVALLGQSRAAIALRGLLERYTLGNPHYLRQIIPKFHFLQLSSIDAVVVFTECCSLNQSSKAACTGRNRSISINKGKS